jgi:hypothetical protein
MLVGTAAAAFDAGVGVLVGVGLGSGVAVGREVGSGVGVGADLVELIGGTVGPAAAEFALAAFDSELVEGTVGPELVEGVIPISGKVCAFTV